MVRGQWEASSRIDHAWAAGQTDWAVRLMARCASDFDVAIRFNPAVRRHNRAPGEVDDDPWLAVLTSWSCVLAGDPIEAARWADAAERSPCAAIPPDGPATIDSGWGNIASRNVLNGVEAMLADAELAVAHEARWSRWRGIALWAFLRGAAAQR